MLNCFRHNRFLETTVDYSLSGYSVHGILQARMLQWAATPSSKGLNPHLLHCKWVLYCWAPIEAPRVTIPFSNPTAGYLYRKALVQKGTGTPIFIGALFTVAKIWKQLKCPTAAEWIKKMWYTHTHTHTHNGILLSHKNNECHLQQHAWP